MENKNNLADIIVAGLRSKPEVAVEAIKESINEDRTGVSFDNIFCSLLKKVFAKNITPDLVLKIIDLYADAASIMGNLEVFYKADTAYMLLTDQKYKEKGR